MSTNSKSAFDWQVETIRAFVVKQKRDRYIDKISSDRKRKEFVAGLSHWNDFDPRFVVKITPSSQHPAGIESILRARGAPAMCQVISENSALDCKTVPIEHALKETVGYEMGTILCCIPGHLAYFENEDCRFILERKS
jgi:hypothetical protein